jgi:DNA-directed RNA polymerase specialized sigma24 family protein
MRYFGGLGMQDIADLLGLSLATVKRDWTVAKLWLYRQLKGLPADESGALA